MHQLKELVLKVFQSADVKPGNNYLLWGWSLVPLLLGWCRCGEVGAFGGTGGCGIQVWRCNGGFMGKGSFVAVRVGLGICFLLGP